MPNYKPLIDKDKLEQLEHYRFRLAEYVESPDFKHEISTSVCKGNITCTGGKHVYCKEQKRRVRKDAWYFKYLSDYNEDESTVGETSNPDLPFYDIIKI